MRTASRLCAAMIVFLAINSIGCNKSSNTANPSSSPSASGSPGSNGSSQANSSPAGGAGSSANNTQPNGPAGGEQAPAPQPIVIPAGKLIVVRLSQPLSSKENNAGDTFSGSIAEPVEVDGRVVIERGAAAHGTVVDAKAMGHFKGGALLQLQLTSVTINGERRPVQTSIWSQSLKGKGKRSAVAIGGGAGLGAALGGIFGGAKGAAIGAAAGAGAGTAGAAYTGNKEIQLAAESAVQFKLKQSIRVQ
jgi:hypothetical protein